MDKPTNGNGQTLRIPFLLLVSAFVAGLIAITTWTYATTASLEQRKADKAEVQRIMDEIRAELMWNRQFHLANPGR